MGHEDFRDRGKAVEEERLLGTLEKEEGNSIFHSPSELHKGLSEGSLLT